ncbi:MAG TPA: dephospho-CoA kinase [Candidatus Bacteroides pullicola]|uniref:Dephospho-CoA kinase n=1 Tax=Candidatus Bacteroides pullicola TaxID=2838475 RepID=A0A9D2CKZ2_9BACE|nr:dephospho-CoA kinase [Candidatus Bacteroides pullicola]
MMQTVFNQAQLDLLDMMSFVKSPHMLSELMQVISDYFAKQADEEIDRLWEDGILNEDKVESFRHLHERTPYQ